MLIEALIFLTSTPIFVALNALMVTVFSSIIYGVEIEPNILLIAFLATFSVYSLNKVTDKSEDSINWDKTFSKGMPYYPYLSVVALLFSFGIGALIGLWTVITILTPIILGLAYSVKLPKSTTRLKEIVGVKSIVVAFSWAFTSSLLPASMQPVEFEKLILVFTYVFVHLLTNTILFDILDIDGDKASGLKTIPIVLGLNRTRKLLVTVNSLLVPWLLYCLMRGLFLQHMIALVFGVFYGYAVIRAFTRRNCNRLLVDLMVDGEWMPFISLMKLLGI